MRRSRSSREKITIMTSSSSHRTVTRQRPVPNWVTHDDHLGLRNRIERALTHSHGGPLEGEVHPGTSSVFWCVMKAGTLARAQGRTAATVGYSRRRIPPTGNREWGGEEHKDRLRWDGWSTSRGHQGSPPVKCVPGGQTR